MRYDTIPQKTAAGQAEMDRREMDLPWRARALLVAIRGDVTVGRLREQFGDRGDLPVLLEGLHELGLIAFPDPAMAALPQQRLQEVSAEKSSAQATQRLRAFLFRRAAPE
jgi:hypothetical protein